MQPTAAATNISILLFYYSHLDLIGFHAGATHPSLMPSSSSSSLPRLFFDFPDSMMEMAANKVDVKMLLAQQTRHRCRYGNRHNIY
jgi:hypothetical protein